MLDKVCVWGGGEPLLNNNVYCVLLPTNSSKKQTKKNEKVIGVSHVTDGVFSVCITS